MRNSSQDRRYGAVVGHKQAVVGNPVGSLVDSHLAASGIVVAGNPGEEPG